MTTASDWAKIEFLKDVATKNKMRATFGATHVLIDETGYSREHFNTVEEALAYIEGRTKTTINYPSTRQARVGSRSLGYNILQWLAIEPLTTGEIFERFLNQNMIRHDTPKNLKRDNANVRVAIHGLKKKKCIEQVENIRRSKWKLTTAYLASKDYSYG